MTRRALYREQDKEREGPEPPGRAEPYRSPWRVDHARLIHSPAFRRLQGKTQLFPGESDFFRNRLTHSLEVAQIAKSIAIKLNYENFNDEHSEQQISPDLVEFAALAHDLGHPPFGHNGEAALDECMSNHGGFEGNAQTLRILARLEKKRTAEFPPGSPIEFEDGHDLRRGLNLTYRSLASVLKYDRLIEHRAKGSRLKKGYYLQERELVNSIKHAVLGDYQIRDGDFQTTECQIMDISDDIAYSTYDFEDALKAGFTFPLDILALSEQPNLLRRIALKVWKRLNKRTDEFDETNIPPEVKPAVEKTEESIGRVLVDLNVGLLPDEPATGSTISRDVKIVARTYQAARLLAKNGYLRTSLTSQLVGRFINGVRFQYNHDCPPLSKVYLIPRIQEQVEILKIYTFETHIETARLKSRAEKSLSGIFSIGLKTTRKISCFLKITEAVAKP